MRHRKSEIRNIKSDTPSALLFDSSNWTCRISDFQVSQPVSLVLLLVFLLVLPTTLHAETGYDAWLRYAPIEEPAARRYREVIPPVIVAFGNQLPVQSAKSEVIRGIHGMLNRTLRVDSRLSSEPAVVLGTLTELRQSAPNLAPAGTIDGDGFSLRTVRQSNARFLVVSAEKIGRASCRERV